MSRPVALNALSAGINRQRVKGGADPKSLYDLLNGYVTISGTIESRPGTVQDAVLPAGTKGLFAFDGDLVVCSHVAQTVPAGYACEIVIHPTEPDTPLAYIHFAGPFLGFPYIAAEFEGGDVFHYWLQARDAWAANTSYMPGDLVEPSVRNGYAYKAHRVGAPALTWEPDVARTVGDVVEPTVENGFKYEVIDTLGSAPRSGATEPAWATEDGGLTIEDTELPIPTTPAATDGTSATTLPQSVIDRYSNQGGSLP